MVMEIYSKSVGGITSPWPLRMVDLLSVCLSISSILMLLGISNSIKRAMNTQINQERMLSYLIEDDIKSINDITEVESTQGLLTGARLGIIEIQRSATAESMFSL